MAKNIFIVNAQIVDANGAFNFLSGYPKTFNSDSYEGDVNKAQKRAEGELSECWGAMCKRDDRQVQVVTLSDAFGNLIEKKSMGSFAEPEAE